MIQVNLTDLASDIKAQDASGCAPRLWCVYEIDLQPADIDRPGHYTSEESWFIPDDCELYDDEDVVAALNVLSDGEDEIEVNGTKYEKVCMMRIPKIVTACFTRQAAINYMESNRHNLNQPFVDALSLHRNKEMIGIREFVANTF